MKVTLKQIAKELDVSISTVSKSLQKQFGNRKTQDLKFRHSPNFIITDPTILPLV
jgi:predicted transcriptional regulator